MRIEQDGVAERYGAPSVECVDECATFVKPFEDINVITEDSVSNCCFSKAVSTFDVGSVIK